jgi:multidrug efflux pump subunit AcrA (membrane-fusion protein)
VTIIDRPATSGGLDETTREGGRSVKVAELIVPLAREQAPPDIAANIKPEPETQKPKRRSSWRVWRGRFVVLLLIAGCVALGIRQVDVHNEHAQRFALGSVTLTADPLAVLSDSTGVVERVLTRPGQRVTTGQTLITVQLPANSKAKAGTKPAIATLVAPTDATVSDISVQPGSSLRNGDVAVRLYQPDQLYLKALVSSSKLPELKVGMTGPVRAGRITLQARLVRIEPVLSGDLGPDGTSTLVLQPVDSQTVRSLVPGLAFDGWLDKKSAPGKS